MCLSPSKEVHAKQSFVHTCCSAHPSTSSRWRGRKHRSAGIGRIYQQQSPSKHAVFKRSNYNLETLFVGHSLESDLFIFTIHPNHQVYLDIERLIKWYRGVLDEGVEKQRIKKYQDFGEKKIKRIEDLPLFADSLWSKKMKEVVDRSDTDKKLFNEDMVHHFGEHQKDNFFIDLAGGCALEEDDTPTTSHAWILDSLTFLEHCRKHNWEIGEPARARLSSVAMMKKLEKVR
ncbi:hypothetical protein L5515_016707 [Caenorhabditis briggsae]|uniref:histone acetyltransferase n=1 Tax=Caenorhabditis briggsae TaxID=6238 RepID=A0AAE9F7I3_CAEBR|nr:hypothetical protein L5515_016707 [Caenorhabditis briggsae]